MADIIFFKAYVRAKEDERKRMRNISMLLSKKENLFTLLHKMYDCIGCSFIVENFGKNYQVYENEYEIDKELLNILLQTMQKYYDELQNRIICLENASRVH
ncbi:MAG: hypothetical protein HFG54_14920 [Lachnospiraceae bacterium]|jgi:hypothetical protein|nr:hypothetical protein [Lachnospiraceae bacterium]